MRNSSKNIVLLGMSGVGKTTVGRLLSKKIKRTFCDIDHEFEEITKIRIPDFFSTYGEDEFRKIERNIIKEILNKRENTIISTGGGIFSNAEIRDFIIQKTNTFFLKASISTLINRLKKNFNNRPMLNRGNLKYNIEKLYQKRIKNYMMADNIIEVDDLSVDEIVLKIIKKI